jgi:uncharacterized protein
MIWRASVVAVFALGCASPALAASFDCAKASRPIDKVICEDPDLTSADSALAANYRAWLMLNPAQANALRNEQRAWLSARDAKCATDTACLKREYAARLAAIQSKGNVTVPASAITALDDSALAKAWPAQRAAASFEEGLFSPDGRYFAFSVSQLVSGDADQVWLYDLRARKLGAAMPPPVPRKTGYTIDGFAFGSDDTLYVQGEFIDWQDQGNNRKLLIAATMARTTEIKALPEDAAASFAAQSAVVNEDDDASSTTHRGDLFDVTAQNEGHGSYTLSATDKKTGKTVKIANGGAEFEHLLFDGHSIVRFTDASGIVTDDLVRGTSTRLVVAAKRAPGRLLDQSRDGRLIAYVGYGSCAPNAYGAVRGGDEEFVCFVRTP